MSKSDTTLPSEWKKITEVRPGDTILVDYKPCCVMNITTTVISTTVLVCNAGKFETRSFPTTTKIRVFSVRGDYEILDHPLSPEEILASVDEDGYIKGIIEVGLHELIENGFDTALDLISLVLTDTDLLSDFHWSVIGHEGSTLHLFVEGDANLILESAGLYGE